MKKIAVRSGKKSLRHLVIPNSDWFNIFDRERKGVYLIEELGYVQQRYIEDNFGITNIKYVELCED